jgi:hypothetical protein
MAVRRGSYVSKKTGKLVWVCDYRDQHGRRHELSFLTKNSRSSIGPLTPQAAKSSSQPPAVTSKIAHFPMKVS